MSTSLTTSGRHSVAGAIPDLRPSLDSDRTTLITGPEFTGDFFYGMTLNDVTLFVLILLVHSFNITFFSF